MSSTTSAAAREQAVEERTADRPATRLARLPTPFWIFTLTLAGVLVGITVTKGVQDPDFFWHVTAGQWIAEHGRVPSTDPFSFTWAGQPWTPHEWLSELLMYWLVSGVGRTGALFVFGLFPAAIVISQGLMLSRQGVSLRAFALPAVLIGLVITPYVTLRPQAVSWLLLSLLIWFLLELKPDKPWRALLLIPFFVLWANLHGVYVIGLGVVAVYCLFTIIGRTPMSQAKRPLAVAAVGVLLASMRHPGRTDWGPLPVPLRGALRLGPGEHPGVAVALVPRAGALGLPGADRMGGAERRAQHARLAGHALLGGHRHGTGRPPQRAHRGGLQPADPGAGHGGPATGARRTTGPRTAAGILIGRSSADACSRSARR